MNIETTLDIVSRTLREKLAYNDEPGNDLIKIVTDRLIDAELNTDRVRMENRIQDKQRRLRNVVVNGADPDGLTLNERQEIRLTDYVKYPQNGYSDIPTDD